MKPIRLSPWDTEFAVTGGMPRDLARRWYARSTMVYNRRAPKLLKNRVAAFALAVLFPIGLGMMYWRFAGPESFRQVTGTSTTGAVFNIAAWVALGLWCLSMLWQMYRVLRRAEPPGGSLAYAAGRARTAPYRRVRRSEDGAPLREEHERRVLAWRGHLQRSPRWWTDFRFACTDPAFGFAQISVLLGAGAVLSTFVARNSAAGARINFGPLMCLGFLAYVGSFTASVVHHRRLRRRLRRTLDEGACPWCQYPLAGLPTTLPGLPGAGPASCHECGSPWPLVPPPGVERIRCGRDPNARSAAPAAHPPAPARRLHGAE